MEKNSKSGQVVIIILLILVVVLTVGLSIATRTVSDIKVAKQTELSSRAFNAAEAGVESVLSGQNPAGNVVIGTSQNPSNYSVSATTQGGNVDEAFVFSKAVAKDDTQQVWLMSHKVSDGTLDETNSEGKNYNFNKLTIYWGNDGYSSSQSDTPALEVSTIYKEASTYKMAKGAYDPNTTRASNNNFATGVNTGSYLSPNNFRFSKNIDLCNVPFNIACTGGVLNGNIVLYALRLRLLYNTGKPHVLAVQPDSGKSLPVQGRLISSTGNAGDVYRKVEVFESYPVLPPIFDYVIFNGSGNSLSK